MAFFKLSLLALLTVGAAMAQSNVYCASDDMRRHYCSVDTRGGVQMMRQRSDASCIAGRTWGYDTRGIWVDRGCRADFALNNRYRSGGYGGSGGYGNTMYCASDDMRRHYCSVNTRGGVQMVRQRSDASCIAGRGATTAEASG